MKNGLRLFALILFLPGTAAAGEFEVFGHLGIPFPFYSQTFTYDPGPVTLNIPNVSIQQQGTFELKGTGGTSFGFGAAYYFVKSVAIEARVDYASIDIKASAASYRVTVNLPAPLPPVNSDLDLGSGTVDLDRLSPISFNLRFQTPGKFGFGVSGGVSYLPAFGLKATQTVGLGVTQLDVGNQRLDVGTLPFQARIEPVSLPGLESPSRWGFNGGVILRIPLNEKVSIVGDARYFRFSESTATWTRADSRALSEIEAMLLAQVQQRLPNITFRPEWFQVTGGLAITF
jgi:hypothetical protein